MISMKITLPLVLLVIISACRKDPVINTTEVDNECPCNTFEDLGIDFPKDSGTYWVYETVQINSEGEEFSTTYIDTVWALGKHTLADGIEYNYNAGYNHGLYFTAFWRDSCGFKVDQYFNSGLFEANYSCGDTTYHASTETTDYYKITNPAPFEKSVPFGDFWVEERESHRYNADGSPVNSCGDIKITLKSYFHNYYGTIAAQYYVSPEYFDHCSIYEKRLIDYYEP
jgi:hypothetical protein